MDKHDFASFKNVAEKRLPACDSHTAAILFGQLSKQCEATQTAVWRWLEFGDETPLSAGGHSVDSLKLQFGMNYMAAAFTIDWLKRDPVRAEEALRRGLK